MDVCLDRNRFVSDPRHDILALHHFWKEIDLIHPYTGIYSGILLGFLGSGPRSTQFGSGGAHRYLELAVYSSDPAVPTGIWSSRYRVRAGVRWCPLRFGARIQYRRGEG